MRVVRDRVRLQILFARPIHELRCAGVFRSAVERILQEPAAQAQDVGENRVGARRRFRLVEQRVRDLRGAGARVSERPPIEQRRVVAALTNGFAKRVARIPRRAVIEMRADLADARDQDPCASAIDARTRPMLISPRIAGGNPSMSAAACLSSAAFCGEPASADA
jgi:hypothetical protein